MTTENTTDPRLTGQWVVTPYPDHGAYSLRVLTDDGYTTVGNAANAQIAQHIAGLHNASLNPDHQDDVAQIDTCPTCGVAVTNGRLHRAWHDSLPARIVAEVDAAGARRLRLS